MIYLIIIFLSFLITILTTPYLISYLIKKDLVDKPKGEERRVHTEPIPRLGGLIIFSVVIIITIAFYQDFYSKKFFLAGALIVFALGFFDDLKPIKWYMKFAVQAIAATFFILSANSNHYTDMFFMGYHITHGFNYLIFFVLIIGLLNAFNLMDGLDGLVTGFSLIVASLAFLLLIKQDFVFMPTLVSATIGTTLGFLKFNANPARIFLGDSGAYTLGYLIASIVIGMSGEVCNVKPIHSPASHAIDLTFVGIVFAIPIADTLRVMLVRLYNRKNPFLPDRNHLHHIIYSQKIRHKTVVLLIHLFTILFALSAIVYAKISRSYGIIFSIILVSILLSIKQLLEFVINREMILKYIRIYRNIPVIFIDMYKKIMIPAVTLALIILFAMLIAKEATGNGIINLVYFIFVLISILYSGLKLSKTNYSVELLVFVNFVVFFLITGLNSFFYKLYTVPVVTQLNINQILVGTLSFMIVVFLLFKERIANVRQNFLTGVDLTLAVLILFVYLAVQMLDLPTAYKISDTLLRSFLVFLFYKILVIQKPKLHFPLYYSTFGITIFAIIKSFI